MSYTATLLAFLVVTVSAFAQPGQEVNYNNDREVFALLDQGEYLWIGTLHGLARRTKSNGEIRFYATANGRVDNLVRSLALDSIGNLWAVSDRAFMKFDGTTWSTYQLTFKDAEAVAVDRSNNIWMATGSIGGVSKFDGTSFTSYYTAQGVSPNYVDKILAGRNGDIWTVMSTAEVWRLRGTEWYAFTEADFGFHTLSVFDITQDRFANIWAGCKAGLAKYDGTQWTRYTPSNSGLRDSAVTAVTEDYSGNIWAATPTGVARFDGTTWKWFDFASAGLPGMLVLSIVVERSGKVWLGTYYGLLELDGDTWKWVDVSENQTGGIAADNAGSGEARIHPNPSHGAVTLDYVIPAWRGARENVDLRITDLLGREIMTLAKGPMEPGNYREVIRLENIPSGSYLCHIRAGAGSRTIPFILIEQ